MPQVSRFYGIVITMHYKDHDPPHFHVRYHGSEAEIDLSGGIREGGLPPKALTLVHEWARLHAAELDRDWNLAAEGRAVEKIPPLA